MDAAIRTRWLLSVSFLAALSCGAPAAPEMPELTTEGFLPEVRQLILEAHAEASKHPRNAGRSGHAAMLLHAHEEYAQAREWYERARRLDPDEFSWAYLQAHAEKQLGEFQEALSSIEAALAIKPDDEAARLLHARLLFDLGRVDAAAETYRGLTQSHPKLAEAWYGLGRCLAARDGAERAVRCLQKAVEIYPGYGQALFALGQQLQRSGQAEEARQKLALAETHRTDAPPSPDPLLDQVRRLAVSATHYIEQARELVAAGRLAEAAAQLERAVKADPASPQASINLIGLYGQMEQFEKAEQAYRRVLELNPDEAEAHYNFGVLAFQQQRLREARAAFERALEINPQDADAHLGLASLREEAGETAAALSHYQQAAQARPSFRLAHFHAGRLLAEQRRFSEAIAHLQQTLEPEDERTPQFLYALAMAQGGSGDTEAALRSLERAQRMAARQGQRELAESIASHLQEIPRKAN